MNLSSAFIARPIATSLLMAGILLVGAAAYPLLPVAPLPQVDFPTIQVTAQLPGASPEIMAASVTQPLERQFGQIPGVTQMTSSSVLGNSAITVQFELSRDIDGAAQDIQTAIEAASGQLPKNLPSPPTYRKINPADAPILILALTSDLVPMTEVDDYAENILVEHLSQISGVAQVNIGGQQKPAVRIQVDPVKLASVGLSREDLRGVIVNATTVSPKGTVDGRTRTFTIYDNSQMLKAAPWDDVIIAYKDGAPVRIRDIGRAIDAPENTRLAAFADGKQAILLAVYKLPGANVIQTVDSIKAALPQLQAAIPPTVKVQVLSDRTQTIRASVADVQFTLLLTIALVVMVIFIFLRSLWATIIPSVAVPVALVGTFAVMYVLGYSLDNLSLMALTIAVGFVVDDAIVMLENIDRHIEEGLSPTEAAIKGAGEIGFTIVSISSSLIAVFIPLFLLGGIVGRLFREFGITVSMTILVSMLGLPDSDADDVLALHAQQEAGPARAPLCAVGAGLRAAARRLSQEPRFGTSPPPDDLCRVCHNIGGDRLSLLHHSEGVLPAAGYRPDLWHFRDGARHLVSRRGAPPAGPRRNRPQGSGSRHRRHEPRRQQYANAKQRPVLHYSEAARPARCLGGRGHSAASSAACQGRRRCTFSAGGSGYQCRRPPRADAISIHPAGRRSRRAEPVVVEDFR
jgi:hypothetical protein